MYVLEYTCIYCTYYCKGVHKINTGPVPASGIRPTKRAICFPWWSTGSSLHTAIRVKGYGEPYLPSYCIHIPVSTFENVCRLLDKCIHWFYCLCWGKITYIRLKWFWPFFRLFVMHVWIGSGILGPKILITFSILSALVLRVSYFHVKKCRVRNKNKISFLLEVGQYAVSHAELHADVSVRYHSGGSMELNACILLLAHMVYL